jgi:glycosyltransferase involved in cell wall biosynthesis
MLFSVIIPTFNRLKYLPATLACVRAQRFTDFETVVVDDGSTDGTRDYLASIPGIRVVHQSNAGPGPARNAGVALAKGEYIAFLDSDDLWFPWTLEAFAGVIAASSPSIVTASVIEFSDEGRLAQVRDVPLRHRTFPDFFSSATRPISVGSGTAVIRRAAFLASGGFTDRSINAEDHDLILRLGDAAGFAQILEPITCAWRRHAQSETADLAKSIDGMLHLIAEEQAGHYPGGPQRAQERRQIITRHLRPISFAALRVGNIAAAARLYRMAFVWHLRSARLSYLAAFPFAMAWRALKGRAQP